VQKRELKLSGNRLKEFPEEVVSLKRLKFLDLSLNEIETIQATQNGFEHFQVNPQTNSKLFSTNS
jgi:hypothetical protein